MKKFIQNKLKEQKGLTLIELLAVIVILAIIAAIAIPAIGNIIENSRYSAVKSDATNALSAANIYFTETPGKTTVKISELKTGGFLESQGKLGADDSITKGTGALALKTAPIKYSGDKTLTFDGATVESINSDNKKGSGEAPFTITGAVTPAS